MIAYFDSSAFVKLVLSEPGTDDARALFHSATRVFSSRLLVPEASAALGRARRMGRLAGRASAAARAEARTFLDDVLPIELTPDIAAAAADIAEEHELRAYDAVHLATYRRMDAPTAVLVSADSDLVRAASVLGHAVAVPGA